MSPKHGMTLFIGIFTFVGGAFFAAGLAFYVETINFKRTASKAEGIVYDIETRSDSDGSSYYPMVRFTPEGAEEPVEFTGGIGSNPSSYKRNQKVKVIYDAANPEKARIDSFFETALFPLVFSGMGGIFLAIGLGFLISGIRNKRNDEWLRLFGKQVTAKITGVEYDTSFKVNGQSPWRITAQWHNPNTNEVHVFRSDHIWFNPSQYITGEEITVLIDPKNPKKYDVDLRFLPKMA